jgi:hypothetical protein
VHLSATCSTGGFPLETSKSLNQILSQQVESLRAQNPAEAEAILFAQHYAENLEQFDPAATEDLLRYYTDGQVAEILAYVRAVTLGSLTGNTLDAILDRFRRDRRSGVPTEPSADAK